MSTPADRALVGDFGSGQALTDDQFRLLEPLIPPAKPGGRPRSTDIRNLLDGLFYLVRTGWALVQRAARHRGGWFGCGYAVTLSGMPFKHNAARRHRIPQARYRVRNWSEYEAGLKRRGDLTLWLDEGALAGWQAPRRSTPGGQAWYSDAAIELVLMLRLVFHLALRQAEGFAANVLRLLGQTLRAPDHPPWGRRSRSFAGRQPKVVPHGPLHLVIDSTGLKLFGQGEWDEEKHGRARRS